MIGFADLTKITVLLFMIVFLLNLLPAFAPPTWTAMSFIGLTIPDINFFGSLSWPQQLPLADVLS